MMHTGRRNRQQFPWKRLLSGLLVWTVILTILPPHPDTRLAAAAEPAKPSRDNLCVHHPVHTEECGYKEGTSNTYCDLGCTETDEDGNIIHQEGCSYTRPSESVSCNYVHNNNCEYKEFEEESNCTHVHDENCGYVEGAGAETEETAHPCEFVCGLCVTGWAWEDEDGILVRDEETGIWGLGMPGTNEENIVTGEILAEMLPKAVIARTAASEQTVDLEWDYGAFPEEGAYEGEFTLTAKLKGEYVLTETAEALEVVLELGGGEMYDHKEKYLNQWSFIARDGSKMTENQVTAAIEGLSTKTRDEIVQWLKDTVVPTEIRGWVNTIGTAAEVFSNVGFLYYDDEYQNEKKDVMTENGWDNKNGQYDNTSSYKWGHVGIEWNFDRVPNNFQNAEKFEFTIYALTPHAQSGSTDYYIYVNSNNPDDYKSKGPDGNPNNKDTSTKPDILSLTITLWNIDLSAHTVPAANPANVTVNLFDYWVKTENPSAATNGDILDKPNSYYHEDGPNGALSTTPTGYSTVNDWNQGINRNHLLLFGDGMIHAGLWNKGAGENCRYGNTYAGMEGIVKNILPESGYPELNLSMADKILTGDNSRDYTLIKDYKLTGDFINQLKNPPQTGFVYDSTDIQNLSKSVIGTWGGNIGTDTESLQYLFDPEDFSTACKRSFTDVKGLFRLDNRGYYFYNMRENFAEFVPKQSDQEDNRFILYDAPATLRTDGDQSVGNFFPFNKGAEVFNGVETDGGKEKLTSTVACSNNSMNHHLGMTVTSEFRQPANGRIHTGEGDLPMTFEFSGDDDVWVFIDDVLVLDLGGIHSELYGTIDFETGDVCIGRAFSTKGIPDNPEDPANLVTKTTLLDLYKAANKENVTKWTNSTFASNTSHILKMFYLERGNYDSSIALRFNLQPLLYQRIVKVDQNGNAVPGVEFQLLPARRTDNTNGIQCLYTDAGDRGQVFYVEQDGRDALVTLTTDTYGSAVFQTDPVTGEYFNFADRGDQYYILKETKAPQGYRSQPVDIVLHYDMNTSMLSVANRWATGAYACSVSNVTGAIELRYGELKDGGIQSGNAPVSSEAQEKGLVVTVPLLKKNSNQSWMALYGSNMGGFNSIPIGSGGEDAWRNAVLRAALMQAGSDSSAPWHLEWDSGNSRLFGTLNDLPGLASRYLINDLNGDMNIVYGIISPRALTQLGINGVDANERYKALGEYIQRVTPEVAMNQILSSDGGNGFRFLSVDQFNRDFRSLIYIPNERRELWVMKVDQDGKPLAGTQFGLYDNESCAGAPVSSGFTDTEGRVIFSPTGQNGTPGQAQMNWADSRDNARYYLREMIAPAGYQTNPTIIPVVVGTYSIYADAGLPDDGVRVMAGVGRLTQTMRQYAMDSDVDVTLQDITAFMQTQPGNAFQMTGWQDAKLAGTDIVRSMNLHFGKNEQVDYGLHDEDGGKIYKPFFVTDTGFVRARVQQNYPALTGSLYEGENVNANKENLGETDLTNLFSLLNMVVVTDRTEAEVRTGKLTVSKKLTGSELSVQDYTKNFRFLLDLRDAGGTPLTGSYYYFYGDDKAGMVSSGEELFLHHDESVTILGLPEGARFAVTEGEETGWYATPSSGTVGGEIVREGTAEASFTNSHEPGENPSPDDGDPNPDDGDPNPDDRDPNPDNRDPNPDNKSSRPEGRDSGRENKNARSDSTETLAAADHPAVQSVKIAQDAPTGDTDRITWLALLGCLSLAGIAAVYGAKRRRGKL